MGKTSQVKKENNENNNREINSDHKKTKLVAPHHVTQALHEVKLMRDGKIPERTWEEIKDEL